MNPILELLAQQAFEPHAFINPFKLSGLTLVFLGWVLFAQWVDKDTIAVNTFRELWNLITVAVGIVAAVLGLFVPMFWLGFALMAVLNLAVMIVYVIHRNGLVTEEETVMTGAHYRRIKAEGLFGKKKKRQVEVKEKVRITGANKKVVQIPDDDEAREQYRLAQDLLWDALWRRAAYVELAPSGQQTNIIYNVDGMTEERPPLERVQGDAIVFFLKQAAGLNMEERRKPQKGQIVVAIGDHKQKVILRTGGSTAGEKLDARIIYDEETFKAPDLGFTPKQLELVTAAREEPRGIIVLSAPPKNGLTTTIYSLTRTHDRFLQNVQMIESERDLLLDNVTQRIHDAASGQTFKDELLKIVRADPDVIVLPDFRDREAAAVAAQAGAQKQKVYVGLHATDVFDALRKWIALVADKEAAVKGLIAVSNQRLLRKLCDQCKQAYAPDPQMMRKLNLPADKNLYRVPEPVFDKHGNQIVCQACQGTGYVGRTAVFEWLVIDDALRAVIQRATSLNEIQTAAMKRGGAIGLQSQALQKVLEGVTSIQEVVRVTRSNGKPAAAPTAGGARPAPRPQPKPKGGQA